MLTLDRVVRPDLDPPALIQTPFAGLRRLGFGFTPGAVGMVAAAPGVGKSAFALAITLDSPIDSLYASPDTDAWTMAIRTLAHNTGHPQSYIRSCLEPGVVRPDEIDVALFDASHVHFSFDSYTTEEISMDVRAYEVVHGGYPALVVVDNLLNISRGGDDDYTSMSQAMDELHALAQTTGAHVLVLHHATGAYDDGTKPIPLSGLVNKMSKLPAQILTLYQDPPFLGIAVVKNRVGKADPSGGLQVRVRFDQERMIFHDQET